MGNAIYFPRQKCFMKKQHPQNHRQDMLKDHLPESHQHARLTIHLVYTQSTVSCINFLYLTHHLPVFQMNHDGVTLISNNSLVGTFNVFRITTLFMFICHQTIYFAKKKIVSETQEVPKYKLQTIIDDTCVWLDARDM